jgi:phosphatidylglycerophosphate synthase
MTHLWAAARSTPGSRQGETLGSILTVAALTAVLGGVLADQAGWHGRYVLAGWLAYAVLGCVVAIASSLTPDRARFGLANQVTLLRAGLVCLAGGALLASGQAPDVSWSLAGLIAVALGLDAVDGWLARRLGLVSAFGARFDVEIDALLLLILALLVWQTGRVDAWVLAIGLLRYAFVLAGRIRPWLRAPLPPSRRRKAICVQQGVTLLICLLPPTTATLAGAAAALALATLVLSFALDIHWLARRCESTFEALPEHA